MDISSMHLVDYLGHSFHCACGKYHAVEINTVEISSNALDKVPTIIRRNGYKKPFVISDTNTFNVAGKRLLSLLDQEKMEYASFRFDEVEVIPDEHALGRLMMNYNPSCDLIIAVGSGTINDTSRYLSHRLGLPYYVVATAPSMDGYASTVAPMVKNNLKTTFECHMPLAIIADLKIIAQAPKDMLAAGFSDVIGKYTALADWKLSSIINGEYYCETIVNITRQSLERTIALKDGIFRGDEKAIAELMEALIIAGIAMSYAGNSRPASGSEHHLSHFYEMRLLLEGKPAILHGTKVGIATVLIAQLYQFLREAGLDQAMIEKTIRPDTSNWEKEIHEVYLEAAPEVVLLEEQSQKNGLEGWQKRIATIAQNWSAICEVLDRVPSSSEVAQLIQAVGGAIDPKQVGFSRDLVKSSILYAKEVRPRYTILQLLWDLNVLSDYAARALEG